MLLVSLGFVNSVVGTFGGLRLFLSSVIIDSIVLAVLVLVYLVLILKWLVFSFG